MIVDNQLLLRHANAHIHRQAGERYAFFDAQSEILIQKTEDIGMKIYTDMQD